MKEAPNFKPDSLRGALRRALLDETPRPSRAPGFADAELWELPEAGRFSGDSALGDPAALIAEFRRQPASQLLTELLRDSGGEFFEWDGRRAGRPPLDGDWAALFLSYVADGSVAVQRFRNKLPGTGLLAACGFRTVPSRQSVDLHFSALEERVDAFDQVTQELIRRAKSQDPRIGENVFVDSTAFHSGSSLEHCCEDLTSCGGRRGAPRSDLRRATPGDVNEVHLQESEQELPDPDTPTTRGELITLPTGRGPIRFRVIQIRGHRYLTRDLSSGVRFYVNPGRFWLGGYQQTAVDMYTRLPVGLSVFPADINETDGYPALLEWLTAADAHPRIVSVDRGFVSKAFYELNTRRGIAVVAPFRKRKKDEALRDRRTDAIDEHGVPRCRFCGGPGDQLSHGLGPFFDSDGEPNIRFRCLIPRTSDCQRLQQIACRTDWVQLPLLAQETSLFHAVRHAHHNKEGNFHADRMRYAIAGKEGLGRLHRSGIDVHRLRCSASLLLNWFQVSLRHGWIDAVALDVSANDSNPKLLSTLHDGIGADKRDDLLRARDEDALELPYGRAARRLRTAYAGSVA